MDTFEKVKDVIESQFLKKMRMSNLKKALRLGLTNNQVVKINYVTDLNEKSINSMVLSINEENVAIDKSLEIPIRAIKEISFN